MDYQNNSNYYLSLVAKAADYCFQPWKHSATYQNNEDQQLASESHLLDLSIEIICRTKEGERCPQYDLELEVYRSGNELNIILSWASNSQSPILWHGEHSLWMDSDTGKRCQAPEDGRKLEALARRLKSYLS